MKQPKKHLFFDKNLIIVFLISMAAVAGITSITPVIPLIREHFNVPDNRIGLVVSTIAFPGILLSLVLGVIIDRVGRKQVLVPSMLLFGISGSLCMFAQTYEQLLWLRVIAGVGIAALATLMITIIGDLFEGEDRTQAMGYNSSVSSVSASVFPVIGGMIAIAGWNYPFLIAAFCIPAGILAWIYLDSKPIETEATFKDYIQDSWNAIANVKVLLLFLGFLVNYSIIFGSYLTYFPILLRDSFHLDSAHIGLLISSGAATTALTSAKIGSLTKRYSETSLFLASYIIYSIILFVIPFADKVWQCYILAIILGFGQGLFMPITMSITARLAPTQNRGAVVSVFSMVLRTGQAVGPLFFGYIYYRYSLDHIFISLSLLTFVTLTIMWMSVK